MDSRTIERADLESKVLSELQEIAQALGVEGHERLRKSDLIEAILAKASEDGRTAGPAEAERAAPSPEAASQDGP
ncbi:MAG TPA: Rho termination factor N-terminal domain-containing protein, partial [Actinomycetota bacterium]|nr:Rho termination factor N-terminal domain-containing protein [Actinomycetota bacterium]